MTPEVIRLAYVCAHLLSEVVIVTQTVPMASSALPMSWQEFLNLGFGNILYFALAGLIALAFKNEWIGIVTFGPFDRGLREFFGRPRKLLVQGPHPYIKGLSNMRRVSVANSVIDVGGRVIHATEKKVYEYKLSFLVAVIDEIAHIKTAVYYTFDETKADAYNAQRQAYIVRRIAAAVRTLIEDDGLDFADLTVEKIAEKCSEDLIKFTGSQINGLTGCECTPVDAQIVADQMGGDSRLPGSVVGVPDIFGSGQTAAA